MQEILRWLASLKGIGVESGAELQFELTGFPSGGLGLLTLLGLALALFLVVFAYRRDGKNLSRPRRVCLAMLRLAAVAVAFLVVLEPNLVAVKKDVRDGHSIILLDLSQSMGHQDAFRRESVQHLVGAWGGLGQRDLQEKTRLDLAKAVLAHDDFALIRSLSAKNKVLIYGFGSGLSEVPLQPVELPKDSDGQPIQPPPGERIPPLPQLERLEADGKYSNIGGAIRAALQKSRDASIAAVIVLTDGRRNIGAKGAEVSRFLTQRKVDHALIVGIGDPSEAQLVGVSRIEAPERAFQRDPFKIRGTVTTQGYDSLNLTVRLLQVPDGGGAGVEVQSRQVAIAPDVQELDVEFDNLEVDQPGVRTYRVEVVPPSGEPLNADRHGKQARVEILAEQTRVLLVAGSPMHEYQILRQLLTRDRTIELSCWLESADKEFLQDGDVNLDQLPSDRKALEPFDVFVFMDPDPNMLDGEFCEMVARQVQENGSGLWWVCGEKYTIDAVDSSASTAPLVDLLPVELNVQLAKSIFGYGWGFGRTYAYEITPQGRNHQVMRLVDADRDQNDILWNRLPGWHCTFPVKKAKPAASVLAVTTAPTKFRESEDPMPLFATHYVGAGRVLFSGIDETYRWRSVFEEQYNRFWVKGIRYLYEGRLTAGSSRLRIDISSNKVELGEPVRITVEAKDPTYQPLVAESFSLQIAREGEPPTNVELTPVDSAPGQFEATFRPARTGFHRIAPVDKEIKVESTFEVVAAAIEREGPVDLAELGAIAAAKGGQLLATPTELFTAVEAIRDRTTTEQFRTPHAMWDSWITIAVILTLLAAEWWLRKMWNLL